MRYFTKSFKGFFSLIFLILVSCQDKQISLETQDRSALPIWVRSEGYVDEHYYSVGFFKGDFAKTLSERVNGAQIDSLNKLKVQLKNQMLILVRSWADRVAVFKKEPLPAEVVDGAVESIVSESVNQAFHVQRWIDPQAEDLYVLVRVKFNDLMEVVKTQMSQVIAQQVKEHVRQAHYELDEQIENIRRRRVGT